jgi:MFS transporter, ACS family, hexuronate transporter
MSGNADAVYADARSGLEGESRSVEPAQGYRWLVLGLLVFATTINYLDRAILGVILPEIRARFHFGLPTYGAIQMMFQVAYAAGSLAGGRLLDRYGTKIGYSIAVAVWSAAAMFNSLARSALQFGAYRTVLGLGEAANFPACNKALSEWFPPSERATAMGFVNAAPNLANIVGPALVIWVAIHWGWQTCFTAVGSLGFVWLPVWLYFYQRASTGNPTTERAGASLASIIKSKSAWAYAWAKFLTDPVWWFYLFWLPTYLSDVRHFTPARRGTALMIIYSISALGSMLGGWVADLLVKRRGWEVGRARKAVMLFCAAVMPVFSAGVLVENANLTVLLFGLATAAHQAWMTNLFTVPSDVFPSSEVGSVNGFGVAVGAIGGAIFSGLIPGNVIPYVGYVPVLLVMSFFYIAAWGILHRRMGDWKMATPNTPSAS